MRGMALMVAVFLLSTGAPALAVDEQRGLIAERIKEANHCQTDADCVVASFGCPFGCGVYVNRKEEPVLREAVESYNGPSKGCMYDCVKPPQPQCVSGKCGISVCETGRVYQPFQCECPASAFTLGFMNTPFECVPVSEVFKRMSELDGRHTPEEMEAVIASIAELNHDFVVSDQAGITLTGFWQLEKGVGLYDFLTGFREYLGTHSFGRAMVNQAINSFVNATYRQKGSD